MKLKAEHGDKRRTSKRTTSLANQLAMGKPPWIRTN